MERVYGTRKFAKLSNRRGGQFPSGGGHTIVRDLCQTRLTRRANARARERVFRRLVNLRFERGGNRARIYGRRPSRLLLIPATAVKS